MYKHLFITFILIFYSVFTFQHVFGNELQQGLGVSLYFPPLSENPRMGRNFTVTLKVDSLAQKVTAINGELNYNDDKLQIIGISKVGSVINLWRQEPTLRNSSGKITFQGDVAGPGFIGNGGTVFSIIFKPKSSGVASMLWSSAEAFGDPGKKNNIISDLENLDFTIDKATATGNQGVGNTILLIINITLLSVIGIAVSHHLFRKFLIKQGEEIIELEHEFHKHKEHNEQKE